MKGVDFCKRCGAAPHPVRGSEDGAQCQGRIAALVRAGDDSGATVVVQPMPPANLIARFVAGAWVRSFDEVVRNRQLLHHAHEK